MTETHPHCQCDFCDGVDCGQDNPEKYAAEQKAQQEEHDAGIRRGEAIRWATALNTLIATESKRRDKESVAMVYSYRIAQIIESLNKESPKLTPDLKEENKPGCFGAIGLPGKRNDPGCPCEAWKDRCRQSQEDY